MSKKWWGVIIASLLVGAILVGVGFYLFEPASFLENLVAESIGLAFALAVIVWLVEGPVLTRQRRVRATLEYKRQVFQLGGEIGTLIVNEIAEPIATDFEPPIDLYGYESGKWDEFEPLLRRVFKNAMDVRQDGIPAYPTLDEETALSIMKGCLSMEARVREVINSRPEFNRWDVLGGFELNLRQIVQHIERAKRLNLIDDPVERYTEIGELGDLLLEMLKGMNSSPERRELW